jgi:hypothetical protein
VLVILSSHSASAHVLVRAGTVDGDEQIQPALFGSHFGNVEVNVPDRLRLELFLGFATCRVRQMTDVMSWQAAV